MKYAVDLHIHSAASPCADKDMTPNNIVNMALVKGLDAIAVTDHNTGANLKAVALCAKKAGLVFIPGIEVETSEEVHVVCLLPDLDRALELHTIVQNALPDIMNRTDIFGSQLIIDENDMTIGQEQRMLLTATNLSIDDISAVVRRLGGAVIPAHVDRTSYSIISNLGFIPQELGFRYLEISRSCDKYGYRASHPELDRYRLIQSSDAHYLGDILERCSMLELEGLNADAIVTYLA
ncbi:MAG: PHP domain-containing protein [Clostridiaceae bacterium]|nr:PHP domain-containing protein [Clostridiaceae bacterium]